MLESKRTKAGLLEDWLVEAGTGEAKRQLCLIRLTKGQEVYEALANALDPKQPRQSQCAMQVFAAAMVHAAFRVAQADVSKQVEIPPEELSPHKLFPLLAFTSIKLIESEFLFARCSQDLKRSTVSGRIFSFCSIIWKKPLTRDPELETIALRVTIPPSRCRIKRQG